MGRLIDADKLIEYWLTPPMNIGYDDEIEDVNNQPTIEAIPKSDYENHLKADLVAILVELQLEIEEEAFDMVDLVYIPNTDSANVILMDDLNKIIQQKINSLKEAHNDREKDI